MIYRRNKKGQMAILIALAFGLLFLLIAMVVNIGFLVAAKINLQNATDLAAYAGAAQQARYLSEIGKWNYEMRRNYKAMVFDYMIVLNGEKRSRKVQPNDPDFKDYITTGTQDPNGKGLPLVCASLQRQGAGHTGAPILSKICQNDQAVSFQSALASSFSATTTAIAAQAAACAAGPETCVPVTFAANAQAAALMSLLDTAAVTGDKFANYAAQPYNYNRRLIGWMLHDYRHLQARIRGVHIGDISLGKYYNGSGNTPFQKSSGRWALSKDKNPTIFKNSPISVAAKVINGYTQTDGSPSSAKILPITTGETLNNPVHNAAYGTFKKNLMAVLSNSAKLYTLIPKPTASGTATSNGMAGGCNGQCPEFTGPYLKLENHDVNFWVTYTVIKNEVADNYNYTFSFEKVTRFPVGVAKDQRVATYYTVVGTASTKDIPFNVFFGNSESSQEATMVAVAAARPFGSRIGPFINEECTGDNLNGTGGDSAKAACATNGMDPLYPFDSDSSSNDQKVPNFSPYDAEKNNKLGVKLCVNKTEYGPMTSGTLDGVNNSNIQDDLHTVLYQNGSDKLSRWRVYKNPSDSNADDGFQTTPTTITNNPTEADYFDNDQNPVHPFGTQDSVVAWRGAFTIPNTDAAQRDNYEAYLDKYKGPAIYQFGEIPDRTCNNQKYKVYVFKYPDFNNDKWDIGHLTQRTAEHTKMEQAFANAMAVNMFEANRYILPYRSDAKSNTQNISDVDVMNYIVNPITNGNPSLFGGVKETDATPKGLGNILFAGSSSPGTNNLVRQSPDEKNALGIQSDGDVFAETFTAWRFGSRGYRVKLINIQDMIGASKGLQNPLDTKYTLPDSNIEIDLSNIKY